MVRLGSGRYRLGIKVYELGTVVVEGDVVMAELVMTGTHLGICQLPVLGGLLVVAFQLAAMSRAVR